MRIKAVLFLLSQCITLFGSTLVQMAIVWYVTLKTSSGAWVAAFSICSYLPQFIISFPAGVWADRFSKKALIILADASIALFTLILMLAFPHIGEESSLLACILVVSVLRSLGAGIQTPAVNAAIPELVAGDKLMRYNGINAAMQSAVQFAAPAAAGAILTVSSLRSALLIDILTAGLGIGILMCVPFCSGRTQCGKVSVLSDMREGIKYAFSDVFLGKLLIVYGLFIFLCVPGGFLAQLFVQRTFGGDYIYLTATELTGFLGMALGGVILGAWGGFKSRVKTLLCGLTAFGMLSAAMGFSSGFPLYLSLMFIYGIALTAVQTSASTLIQERSLPSMQGRMFGLLSSAYSGFLPIGMAVCGPLADAVPLKWIMIASGAALMLMAGVMSVAWKKSL